MKRKSIFSMVAVLLVIICLFSCGAIMRSIINKDENNIPPDFGKNKTTVLIIKTTKTNNRDLERSFIKHYKGDYLFVDASEFGTNYGDISKYRFTFQLAGEFIAGSTLTKQNATESISVQLYDRLNKKTFDTGVSSGADWQKIASIYIQKMEKFREKNSVQ